MMARSLLQLFFYFVILYSVVEGYVGIAYPEEKPERFANEPGCYVSILDRVLETGVPFAATELGKCELFTCQEDESVHITGCGAIGVSEGCELVPGDKSLSYPKCCNNLRCKDANGDYVIISPYQQ